MAEGENRLNLVLHKIGEHFDSCRDVAVGTWCFSGSEAIFPEWEELEFIDPFVSIKEKREAANKTFRLANHLILKIGEDLNERHGIRYSQHFWRWILVPWVQWAADLTWYTYQHTAAIIDKLGDYPVEFPVYDQLHKWNFDDFSDFFDRGFSNVDFRAWLTSLLLDEMAPKDWKRRASKFEVINNDDNFLRSDKAKPRFWSRAKHEISWRLPFTHVAGINFEKVLFSALMWLKPQRPSPARWVIPASYDPHDDFPAGYLNFLNRIIPVLLPNYLGDGFLHRLKHAQKHQPKLPKLIIGAPDAANLGERFRTALAVENGSKVVVSQHGGSYGTFLVNPIAAQIEYLQDYFITWGWTEQEDYTGNFIPLPSPLLSKTCNRRRKLEKSLILVGTRMTPDSPRILGIPNSVQWLDYRREKVRFIKKLDSGPESMLSYRPYKRAKTSFEDENYVRQFAENIPILTTDLHDAMLGCKLLVVDHPMTTLNLALAANIPTISFWQEDHWAMCRQVEPIFDEMRHAGILFNGGDAAAKQVNAIWDNVEEWWGSSSVQSARDRFCHNLARADRMWWWEWTKAIWRM